MVVGAIPELQSGGAAKKGMVETRQTRQPETIQRIQKRQDVKLSPEQQKIADLVGRGVNTVKDIAYLILDADLHRFTLI